MIQHLTANFLSPAGGVIQRIAFSGLMAALLWTALSWIASKIVRAAKNNKDPAEPTGIILIVLTLLTSVFVTVVIPLFFTHGDTHAAIVLGIHRLGVGLLGDFLFLALCLQVQAFFGKRYDISALRRTYRRWVWITEVMPAPAAIMIVFTGFYRVFSVAGYSLGQGWLLGLIVIMAIMMADGIFFYTPAVRELSQLSNCALDIEEFKRNSRNRVRDIKLLFHSLSFPLVLLLPISKFGQGGDAGLSQLAPAIFLFAVLFLLVGTSNRWGKSYAGTKGS